ncbi:hypothetical protein L207DRAFT_497724 [Hyaloscypha variabilis F]|uniref:Methyltransferase domain-containing protein n=1 Tax=Hyaloscypha variabilis (strain UAMH 11265 / GT02V1 / F) TaxID=1149755 RepID=A0A2J6R775_HYAVF|nr:hypothetical protein L207DRAFT_497724 [Hyaloscypha variabilis F]
MAEEEDQRRARRYQKDLPDDRTNFAKAWKLLEEYGHIPPEDIDAHVIAVAYSIFHYGCLGGWRFLDLYLTTAPEYPDIIARLKAGDKLLDLGCCFGHILRQIAFDGAPSTNLTGADLRPEFVQLGYELFQDKETFGAQFVTGDILNPTDTGLAVLDSKFDIVHTASFFHLFGWDDQVKIGQRVVKFFKPSARALILGRQSGRYEPLSLEAYRQQGGGRYQHNIATLQNLWDAIGRETGTKWKVTGQLLESTAPRDSDHSLAPETPVDGRPRVTLRFAVFKLD